MDSRSARGVAWSGVAVDLGRRRGAPDADTVACIRRTVDAWPPLTAEQYDRIALLLRRPCGTSGNGTPRDFG